MNFEEYLKHLSPGLYDLVKWQPKIVAIPVDIKFLRGLLFKPDPLDEIAARFESNIMKAYNAPTPRS